MLKTNVIALNIGNLTDARYFASKGANLLAFIIDSSKEDYLNNSDLKMISNWIAGVNFAIQQDNLTISNLLEAGEQTGINTLCINKLVEIPIGTNNISIIDYSEDVVDIMNKTSGIKTWIIDFGNSPIELSSLSVLNKSFDIYIKGNIEKSIEKIIEKNFKGICLEGGSEEKAGYKSFENIDNIFNLIDV